MMIKLCLIPTLYMDTCIDNGRSHANNRRTLMTKSINFNDHINICQYYAFA